MKEDFWASHKGFFVLAITVVGLWAGNFFLMLHLFPSSDGGTGNAGTAGDMFGGVTALFSGLAFAGLVTALFMQRRELEMQRRELSQTREVFSVQRFESTFFGLLQLLNNHVNSIEASKGDLGYFSTRGQFQEERGRAALALFAEHLPKLKEPVKETNDLGEPIVTGEVDVQLEDLIQKYEQMFQKHLEHFLAPYFRLIYNILRHIEKGSFSDDQSENDDARLTYSKILRAHLTSAEVKLLMFNCASVYGAGLKEWVEKYSMLRHITRGDYDSYTPLVDTYDPLAFRFGERSGRE